MHVCALTRVHIQTVRRVLSVRAEALHGQLQLLLLPAPELPLLVGADQGFHGKSVGSRAQSCGRSPPLTHFSQIHPTGGTRRKTHSVRPTQWSKTVKNAHVSVYSGTQTHQVSKVIPTVTSNAASNFGRQTVPSRLRVISSPGGVIVLMRSVSQSFHSAAFFFSFCPPNFSLIDTHFWRSFFFFFSGAGGGPPAPCQKRTSNEKWGKSATQSVPSNSSGGRRASWKKNRNPDCSSLMNWLHNVAYRKIQQPLIFVSLNMCLIHKQISLRGG